MLIQETNLNGIKVRVTKALSQLPYDVVVSIDGVVQEDICLSCVQLLRDAIVYADWIMEELQAEFAIN